MTREFEFTLVLTGVNDLSDSVMDALFEAGCDDANLSLRLGRVHATFARDSESLRQAVFGAIENVRAAGIGADVLRVDPCNFVNQSEIARRTNRTRQQIGQFIADKQGPGGFPPPACDLTNGKPIWYWCEVASWFWQHNMLDQETVQEAEEIDVINDVLEWGHSRNRNPGLSEEVMRSVGFNCCE